MTTFVELKSHRARQQFLNTNVPFERHTTEYLVKHGRNGAWWLQNRTFYEIPNEALYKVKPIKGMKIFKNNPVKELVTK